MADVVVKYTSDMQKLLADQDKLIAKQSTVITKMQGQVNAAKSAGKEWKATGKASNDAMGASLQKSLSNAATQFVAVEGAARLLGDAMRFVKEQTDQAMASFDRLDEVRKKLSQVAVTAQDRQALASRADELAAREGVDREVVREVLFSARSEGFEGSVVDEIIKNASVVGPQAAAGVAGQVPALFKGSINADEAINATLAAAQASRLSFEEIAKGMPGAAEGAGLAGSGASETFALESVLASRFKSGETAADRIKAFGTKVSLDEELAGGGILEAVRKLQEATPDRRKEFLGSGQEINVAFEVISQELDAIIERQKAIDAAIATAGGPDSVMDIARRAAFSGDTEVGRQARAQRTSKRAEVGLEIARERKLAEGGFETKAARDRVQEEFITTERSSVEKYAASWAGALADLVSDDARVVEFAARMGAEIPSLGLNTSLREARALFTGEGSTLIPTEAQPQRREDRLRDERVSRQTEVAADSLTRAAEAMERAAQEQQRAARRSGQRDSKAPDARRAASAATE